MTTTSETTASPPLLHTVIHPEGWLGGSRQRHYSVVCSSGHHPAATAWLAEISAYPGECEALGRQFQIRGTGFKTVEEVCRWLSVTTGGRATQRGSFVVELRTVDVFWERATRRCKDGTAAARSEGRNSRFR